jgi:N-acetylglucosaminyldiphosphoundecaprenol N-acetyl-beta-D-mannosaminyltransferase
MNDDLSVAAVPTVHLAATDVAAVTLDEAVAAVLSLVQSRAADGAADATADAAPSAPARLVVTANVDHLVTLERDAEFARAYATADLRVADGAPLLALARLLGTPLPARVTGVDLTWALLAAAEAHGFSVYLLGGADGVLTDAVHRIETHFPRLTVSGASSGRLDLDGVTDDERVVLAELEARRPDLLLLFLGAPKQEKWFCRRREGLPPLVALGLGGTVEFLAGHKRRAPRYVQSVGGEWLWRLAQDPRRLARRYLVRDPRFLWCALRQIGETRRDVRRRSCTR